MKDMQAVRYNEKVKRLSTLIGGGGLAFIVTTVSRWLDGKSDFSSVLWILTGIMLTIGAVQMNDLLESEDAE